MYKYNEGKHLEEIQEYIDQTYDQHYSGKNGTQTMDLIISSGHGEGFAIGAILKYASRYKKKGQPKYDLLKIIHYAIMLLYLLEQEEQERDDTPF